MVPVMFIEVLDTHGRVQLSQRVVGVGSQCRIGRSLACDVVLNDEHVAAQHTLLTLLEDGRVHVQDLDTRNGTRIDGERIAADHGETIEHGEFIIGRTRLQVRTAHTPLAPERVFHRDLLRRYRTLLATIGMALTLSLAAFSQWLNAPEHLAAFTLGAVLITLVALSLWTGLWSLITHLNHGAWQVRIHLAIVANCMALGCGGYWLYRVGAFATQWTWLHWALAPIAVCLMLLMMYLHLRKATYLNQRASLLFAGIATLAVGGALWLVDLQIDTRTVNRITHGPAVYPPAIRLAPSVDVSDYLSDATALKRAANRHRQESLVTSPLLDEDE